jgi:hypothetical protein
MRLGPLLGSNLPFVAGQPDTVLKVLQIARQGRAVMVCR